MNSPLLNPIDRPALRAQLSAPPFPHFCIDNFLEPDFAEEVFRALPDYATARGIGFEFNAVNEKHKTQVSDARHFPPAIAKLNQLLASREYIDLWCEVTGIPNLLADPDLMGGGIHETDTGGRLDVHVDFNYIEERQWHRRLNVLIYFNKGWKEEYGEYLDIWDKDVKKCYGSFAPIFNRACGFCTSEISYHGVTPLHCPPGVVRKSFAAYYYTQEAPAHWDGTKHSTVFKARPDEWLRGHLLIPAESTVSKLKRRLRGIKRAVKRGTS